jgi:hypothetical protein
MTCRAFAGKRELTPPPARLDQRSNLSPCSRHGPYVFSAKETNFASFMPHGHATAPKQQAPAALSKGSDFATKSPAIPGFSIFGDLILLIIVNRISAVKTAFVKAATI